jgi:DNA-binding transcriptional ArsR family regulator
MVAYSESTLDAVFTALGDPTRRQILVRLRDGAAVSVSEIGRPFSMSMTAVTKHLRYLRNAGLVDQRKQGRQRLYWLRPEPLRIANGWLAEYELFWSAQLESLNTYIKERDD